MSPDFGANPGWGRRPRRRASATGGSSATAGKSMNAVSVAMANRNAWSRPRAVTVQRNRSVLAVPLVSPPFVSSALRVAADGEQHRHVVVRRPGLLGHVRVPAYVHHDRRVQRAGVVRTVAVGIVPRLRHDRHARDRRRLQRRAVDSELPGRLGSGDLWRRPPPARVADAVARLHAAVAVRGGSVVIVSGRACPLSVPRNTSCSRPG